MPSWLGAAPPDEIEAGAVRLRRWRLEDVEVLFELVSSMGLRARQGPGTLEIGYWIAAAHTGRGHATSAAAALTGVALGLPGVERVEIRCDEANRASAAVPRRLGFTVIDRAAEAPGETGRGMIWTVRREGLASGLG